MGVRSIQLPPMQFAEGSREGLKWLALLLMTGDHVNKYLFNETLPVLFEAGRLAMPIFVMVLACNLAQASLCGNRGYQPIALRLLGFGLLATPSFIALGGVLHGWYPLNILFTLLVITLTTACCERAITGHKRWWAAAFIVLALGGALVEFWWPAILLGLGVGWYARKPNYWACAIVLLALLAVCRINGNAWAFAAVPLLLVVSRIRLPLPRFRWLFYIYYPLHLTALWLIRIPMAKAGYLFFL